MDILQLRVIERVLAVAIGGLSIFLGYRLFIRMPEQRDGSGKISLPGDVSIMLSRVGPGVFFSLFGVLVVGLSLYRGLTIDESAELRYPSAAIGATANVDSGAADSTRPAPARARRVVNYLGPLIDGADASRRARAREDARRTIADLDTLRGLLRYAPPAVQGDMDRAIRDAKVATLGMVWGDDWGDFAAFRNWVVDQRETEPVPVGVTPAAIDAFRQRRAQ